MPEVFSVRGRHTSPIGTDGVIALLEILIDCTPPTRAQSRDFDEF